LNIPTGGLWLGNVHFSLNYLQRSCFVFASSYRWSL